MARNEPRHLFRQAQFVKQFHKARYSNLSCKYALGIVGHIVVRMFTCTQMGRDSVKVDRQSHSHAVFGAFREGLSCGGGGVRDLTGGSKLLARDRRHNLLDE